MNVHATIATAGLALTLGASAHATVTITRGASAPTYSSTLTFDEVGGPTGMNLPAGSFAAYGMAEIYSGEGSNNVGSYASTPGLQWLGADNVFYGPFGVFMEIGEDVTAFSLEFWDSSGPPTFSGGGAGILVFNDGVQVGSLFGINPAFGGFGDSWFNIVATDGMVFDEVRAVGFGFFPQSYVDNLSWQVVPTPGAAALLTLSGAATLRRRRA